LASESGEPDYCKFVRDLIGLGVVHGDVVAIGCRKCGTRIPIESEKGPVRAKCPSCGAEHRFKIQAEGERPAIRCDGCGRPDPTVHETATGGERTVRRHWCKDCVAKREDLNRPWSDRNIPPPWA